MRSRDISVGAHIQITTTNGIVSALFVREIKDGKVIFAKSMCAKRGRWWLPYKFVKSHGTLLMPGVAGAEVGDREPKGCAREQTSDNALQFTHICVGFNCKERSRG